MKADAEPEVDTVSPVQVREHLRELGPEHAQQRQAGCLKHGHVCAGAAGGRGDFQADPAAADDDLLSRYQFSGWTTALSNGASPVR